MGAGVTDVDSAIEGVREAFPFPSYLSDEFGTALGFIAGKVRDQQPPRASLLDIGCGPMNVTAVFARLGYDCAAVDDLSDPWHLLGDNRNAIEQFATEEGIRFHRHEPPDYGIPFDQASFDIVLLKDVVEHLHESPRNLLNAAFTMAHEGGHIVVTMPNSVNLRKRLAVVRGRTNYPPVAGFVHSKGVWRGHVREYTLDETRWLLEEMGGRIVEATTFHSLLDRVPSVTRRPYVWLTRLISTLRDSIFVMAEKPTSWRPVEFDDLAYWDAIRMSLPAGAAPERVE